jgi:hypothetical protein
MADCGRPGSSRDEHRDRTRDSNWWCRKRRAGHQPVNGSLVAVVIAMSGTAYAATGGSFILGRANHETSTASLADSKGTPLALSAPAHRAPLAVNRNTMVKNLNAQYLGGLTATGLAETGGEGFTAPNTRAPISSTATIVASTGPLHSGTYYVSATAKLFVVTGDGEGGCWIATSSAPDTMINLGRESLPNNIVTVGETAAVSVTAGQTLEELCDTDGSTSGSTADDAGIVAIRVLSSSH